MRIKSRPYRYGKKPKKASPKKLPDIAWNKFLYRVEYQAEWEDVFEDIQLYAGGPDLHVPVTPERLYDRFEYVARMCLELPK